LIIESSYKSREFGFVKNLKLIKEYAHYVLANLKKFMKIAFKVGSSLFLKLMIAMMIAIIQES